MKKSRLCEAQITALMRQAESGVPVASLCRQHWLSSGRYSKWYALSGGIGTWMTSEMMALGVENNRLKR